MGVFERRQTRDGISTTKSTKGFYFGATEAEGENIHGSSTLEYFDDYLEVMDQLNTGRFMFIGRKGVGKSAIAKYIKDSSDESDSSFATILRISDFELEKSIQLPAHEEKNRERLIFEWLILVNIVKQIIKNKCGNYTQEYSRLEKFLEINAGIVNVDQFQVIEGNKGTSGEVNFGGLKHLFGGVFKRYFGTKLDKAPFYKLIPPLKDMLNIMLDFPTNKDLEFWLLFDDLDVNFNLRNETDNNKIMELIRVSKMYNNEVFKKNKAKVLIFLRDDIRDSLINRYSDSAKIFSTYEILLNWYNHKSYTEKLEQDIPLKKLANKRIEINFKKHHVEFGDDPWSTLFENLNYNFYETPFKSSFKYILDFTFYRPRDIITFLTTMSTENCSFPIEKKSLKHLINKYISININEIKSELRLVFSNSEIELLFQVVFPMMTVNQNISLSNLKNELNKLHFKTEVEKVIDILLSYSLILFVDSEGTIYFNYRDNNDIGNIEKETLNLTLPKCIYHNYKTLR